MRRIDGFLFSWFTVRFCVHRLHIRTFQLFENERFFRKVHLQIVSVVHLPICVYSVSLSLCFRGEDCCCHMGKSRNETIDKMWNTNIDHCHNTNRTRNVDEQDQFQWNNAHIAYSIPYFSARHVFVYMAVAVAVCFLFSIFLSSLRYFFGFTSLLKCISSNFRQERSVWILRFYTLARQRRLPT